jgi:hypothetical protein
LMFISIYQGDRLTPPQNVKIATIVRQIEIARPGETAAVRWSSPYERHQWVVVFDVDRVLFGRFERPQLRFLVHSPSADLGVRKTGQHVVLERRDGEWQQP